MQLCTIERPGRIDVVRTRGDTTLSTSSSTTITDRFGTVATFNASGYRTSLADRYGNTLQFTWTSDKLTSITDTLGRITTLSYGTDGRLSSITDFGGRVWAFQYDYLGQLHKVTTPSSTQFPSGRSRWFSYSRNHMQARFRSNLVHVWSAKGPLKHGLPEIAPRLGSDSVAPIERIRRGSQSYLEDFAIEKRPKMAPSWDARMGTHA